METVFAGVAIWVRAWSGVRAQWKGPEMQGHGASWLHFGRVFYIDDTYGVIGLMTVLVDRRSDKGLLIHPVMCLHVSRFWRAARDFSPSI